METEGPTGEEPVRIIIVLGVLDAVVERGVFDVTADEAVGFCRVGSAT